MPFKELFPAEEERLIAAGFGKWFVRTMDGGGVLAADKSYTTIAWSGGVMPAANLVYFDSELLAIVGAWDYYHHNNEYFPDDQRARWNQLYMKQAGRAGPVDFETDDVADDACIQSEVMEF